MSYTNEMFQNRLGAFMLLVSFAGMAVFGMFVMAFSMAEGHGGCLAALMGNGTVCFTDILAFLESHFSFFHQFVQAIIGGALALFFLFFVLVLFILSSSFPAFFSSPARFFVTGAALALEERAWLSLLETSPTSS